MRGTRLGALGLRGRIVGAMVLTTAVTLAVAAVALLGPLQRLVRDAELKTLVSDVRAQLPAFLELTTKSVDRALAGARNGQVADAIRLLHLRAGGPVTLLAYPMTVVGTSDPASADDDPFDDATAAFRSGHSQKGFATIDGAGVVRYALPIAINDERVATSGQAADQTFVLAVRKSISGIPSVAAAVRSAFITAALTGLAFTLLIGLVIAATMVRRLRRLRQAALQLAQGGPPLDVPDTRARDEVGDLTRTFKIMQRRLAHQEEARRAFVATASHELRTPLTSLDGMLELLEDDLRGGDPDLRDAEVLIGRARAQARRLSRLAKDLLDLSRLDAEVALRSEPVELGELSRAVLAEFELGASERDVHADLDDGGTQVWALADPGSVAQILRILLDNALGVTPAGGEIAIRLSTDSGVSLTVHDSGPGVPEDERQLIFERFKRGSTGSGRGGFGLGLAIGRELAQRMGGELLLLDGDGPGATFSLRLPAAGAPTAAPASL